VSGPARRYGDGGAALVSALRGPRCSHGISHAEQHTAPHCTPAHPSETVQHETRAEEHASRRRRDEADARAGPRRKAKPPLRRPRRDCHEEGGTRRMRGRGHGGRPRHPCGVPVAIVATKEGRGGCAGGGHGRRPRHPAASPSDCHEEVVRLYGIGGAARCSWGRCAGHGVAARVTHTVRTTGNTPLHTCSPARKYSYTRCERGGEGTDTTCGGTSSTPLTRNERRDRLQQTERLMGGSRRAGRRDGPQGPRRRAAKGPTPRVEVPRRPRSRRTSSGIDCSKQND
jgi:hypothetical protein